MSTEIIVSIISAIAIITASIIAYRKDVRLKVMEIENRQMKTQISDKDDILTEANIKVNILDKLANFGVFQEIKASVDRIFENTKADRFLIIFALNGTRDFRTVSVVFEQHQHPRFEINAIVRYRDVQIDNGFRKLLRNAEDQGEVVLDTSTMPNQLLKDFYTIEQITHCKFKFIMRKHMDAKNDMVMFSSIATHEPDPFDNLESAIIKTEFEGSIMRIIKNYL